MAKFDYDNISDSLFVSVKKENERVEGSAEVGDIIFDFTKEGKIVNIEIREISTYLSNIQILDKSSFKPMIEKNIMLIPEGTTTQIGKK